MTFAQASECEETIQRRTSVRGVGRVVVWDPLWKGTKTTEPVVCMVGKP